MIMNTQCYFLLKKGIHTLYYWTVSRFGSEQTFFFFTAVIPVVKVHYVDLFSDASHKKTLYINIGRLNVDTKTSLFFRTKVMCVMWI